MAGAFSTPSTFIYVNISRFSYQSDLKVARLSLNPFNLSMGKNIDIQVSAKLHELGRDNSHGAIVGRKGLIQLSHDSAHAG